MVTNAVQTRKPVAQWPMQRENRSAVMERSSTNAFIAVATINQFEKLKNFAAVKVGKLGFWIFGHCHLNRVEYIFKSLKSKQS